MPPHFWEPIYKGCSYFIYLRAKLVDVTKTSIEEAIGNQGLSMVELKAWSARALQHFMKSFERD